jgi:hypothetical protein
MTRKRSTTQKSRNSSPHREIDALESRLFSPDYEKIVPDSRTRLREYRELSELKQRVYGIKEVQQLILEMSSFDRLVEHVTQSHLLNEQVIPLSDLGVSAESIEKIIKWKEEYASKYKNSAAKSQKLDVFDTEEVFGSWEALIKSVSVIITNIDSMAERETVYANLINVRDVVSIIRRHFSPDSTETERINSFQDTVNYNAKKATKR